MSEQDLSEQNRKDFLANNCPKTCIIDNCIEYDICFINQQIKIQEETIQKAYEQFVKCQKAFDDQLKANNDQLKANNDQLKANNDGVNTKEDLKLYNFRTAMKNADKNYTAEVDKRTKLINELDKLILEKLPQKGGYVATTRRVILNGVGQKRVVYKKGGKGDDYVKIGGAFVNLKRNFTKKR